MNPGPKTGRNITALVVFFFYKQLTPATGKNGQFLKSMENELNSSDFNFAPAKKWHYAKDKLSMCGTVPVIEPLGSREFVR